MVAVLSNQPSSKCSTKPSDKKSTLARELKALGLTDPQEESSRSSEHSPRPETPQPEGPSHPEIESPAETPVPIKQSASPQKSQKLPETTNEPSEPPEPSEPDDSDSDTSDFTSTTNVDATTAWTRSWPRPWTITSSSITSSNVRFIKIEDSETWLL